MRVFGIAIGGLILIGLAALGIFAAGWWGSADIDEETSVIVSQGQTLTGVAEQLAEEGLIGSADGFLLRAKIFGSGDPVRAGEFALAPGLSQADILDTLQHGTPIQRFVTIPEGMPSVLVADRINATPLMTGEVEAPREGSILPGTYAYERGQSRQALVERMQAAMDDYLAEAWEARTARTVATTPQEAIVLASIVEKETGLAEERRMVAGLYSNRIRTGMMLQADPTIIYPITRGRPLGRRIRQSEIQAVNDYNTYTMVGLPSGPITNPGRESIAAVLNPAETDAIYMVADGSNGHAFASTLEEHNRNVEEWFTLRRQRGEM